MADGTFPLPSCSWLCWAETCEVVPTRAHLQLPGAGLPRCQHPTGFLPWHTQCPLRGSSSHAPLWKDHLLPGLLSCSVNNQSAHQPAWSVSPFLPSLIPSPQASFPSPSQPCSGPRVCVRFLEPIPFPAPSPRPCGSSPGAAMQELFSASGLVSARPLRRHQMSLLKTLHVRGLSFPGPSQKHSNSLSPGEMPTFRLAIQSQLLSGASWVCPCLLVAGSPALSWSPVCVHSFQGFAGSHWLP